jgi:hypothetical protein
MNHINTLQAVASPTLRAIMDDRQPAAIRLRQVAAQMHGKIEAGNLRRLPACELVEMRAIVFALHDVADKLLEIPDPPPMRARRRWWWGK